MLCACAQVNLHPDTKALNFMQCRALFNGSGFNVDNHSPDT